MTRTGPWVTGVGSFVGADYFDRTSQAYNLPAQKGASGSAVVNLEGELVGQIANGGIASQTEKTTLLPKKYDLFAVELLVDSVSLRPAPYSDIEAIPVSLAVSNGAPSNYIKEMIEKWAPGELPE
jgi:S1-C subfamily serine protease